MNTATSTEMITLPATLVTAPASEYSLSKVTTMGGRETDAYEATLKRGTKAVAIFRNDGNGGETFIDFFNRDEQDMFNQYVSEWPLWDLNDGEGEPNLVQRHADNVADALFHEWKLLRYCKRVSKTKFLVRFGSYETGTLAGLTYETPGALEKAVKAVGNSDFMYWHGTGWVQA